MILKYQRKLSVTNTEIVLTKRTLQVVKSNHMQWSIIEAIHCNNFRLITNSSFDYAINNLSRLPMVWSFRNGEYNSLPTSVAVVQVFFRGNCWKIIVRG